MGEFSLETALKFMEDFKGERTAAIKVLVSIAPKNEEQVVHALLDRVIDRSVAVRPVAVRALLSYVDGHVDYVLNALVGMLQSHCTVTQHDAHVMEAMERVAGEDFTSSGLPALHRCILSCNDVRGQTALIQTLGKCSPKNCDDSISVLIELLTEQGAMKAELIKAMMQVVLPGNSWAASTMIEYLKDSRADVRSASLDGLAKLGEKGDEKLIDTIISMLKPDLRGEDPCVRSASLDAFANLGKKGDEKVIDLILSLFDDPSSEIKKKAVDALIEVAASGDKYAIAGAIAFLTHDNAAVRFYAIKAIEQIAHGGDELAISVFRERLNDPKHGSWGCPYGPSHFGGR